MELANDINSHMPEYVTRRISEHFNDRRRSVNGSRVLLLGLAYKKNTGDARESPALRISQLLLDMGAQVRAADPHVVESLPVDTRLVRVEPTPEELAGADVVVLLTDHDSFDYELVAEHAPSSWTAAAGCRPDPRSRCSEAMRIVCVAGARPNYMKTKPVMDALERRGAEVLLVHTGQHYDPAMNDVFFADLGIRPPDRFLGVGSGSHAEQTGRVMTAFEPLLEEVSPDIVVVVGDINSTLACALVTAKAGPLLAHVEAGLRSRDWGMPEEVNRVATDRVSDYLLAPSPDAVDNLRAEGYREDQIHLVGNVMIDTLLANLERARASDVLGRYGLSRGSSVWSRCTAPPMSTTPRSSPGCSRRWARSPGTARSCCRCIRGRPGSWPRSACRAASNSCRPPGTWTSSRCRTPPVSC